MQVELIPVIEVGYHNQGLTPPDLFPTWKYPVAWDNYAACNQEKAGFSTKLAPYTPGLFFYRVSEIEFNNLKKLVADHLDGFLSGKYGTDEINTLFGGYILRINNQNILYPQCCGELGDIIYWKHLAKYGRAAYYNGHPAPVATFTEHEVILHFQSEYESFVPETAPQIRVSRESLSIAYDVALTELNIVSQRLSLIQQELRLPIKDLSYFLIYQNLDLPNEAP